MTIGYRASRRLLLQRLQAGCALLAVGFSVACGSSDTSGSAGSGSGGGGTVSSSGAGASGAGGSGAAGSGAGGSGDLGGSGVGGSNAGGSGAGSSGAAGSGAGSVGGSGVGGSGAGGTSGSGDSDGGPPANKPPCITKATQAAYIGDSYITGALSPALQATLDPILMMNGAVTGYTNKAVAGTAMGSGGALGLIPPQFDSLVGTDIRLIILDGGGNDILIPAAGSPDCKNLMGNSMNAACQAIVTTAITAGKTLMQKMADNGVKDVIFFQYPHIPSVSGGLGGTNSNELLDYSYPLTKASCDGTLSATGGKLSCHFLDLRMPFANNGGLSNIGSDGVHPTQSGQNIMAKEIWNIMKSACLGQPTSSGCCTP